MSTREFLIVGGIAVAATLLVKLVNDNNWLGTWKIGKA